MNKLELSLLAGMVITVFLAGISSFARDYGNITDGVFRLHILANSDSAEDQELKLAVRDAILESTAELFKGSASAEEAAAIAEANINLIENTAMDIIAEKGYDYSVKCKTAGIYFPARKYGEIHRNELRRDDIQSGFTLPAGVYSALRVEIGEAKGGNWWCVMFPPLCLPAAGGEIGEAVLADCGVFTDGELDMLLEPEKYEVRFYFVELYHKLWGNTEI